MRREGLAAEFDRESEPGREGENESVWPSLVLEECKRAGEGRFKMGCRILGREARVEGGVDGGRGGGAVEVDGMGAGSERGGGAGGGAGRRPSDSLSRLDEG